jgi:transporter family protein
MGNWILPTLLAMLLWGIVGLLQKLGSNRLNALALVLWVTIGYIIALPCFSIGSHLTSLSPRALCIGIIAGGANAFGTWFLFAALERGAKASVAVPLTALYPLITLVLAFVFLGERLSALEWTGVVLALCGGVMLSYEKTPPAADANPKIAPEILRNNMEFIEIEGRKS